MDNGHKSINAFYRKLAFNELLKFWRTGRTIQTNFVWINKTLTICAQIFYPFTWKIFVCRRESAITEKWEYITIILSIEYEKDRRQNHEKFELFSHKIIRYNVVDTSGAFAVRTYWNWGRICVFMQTVLFVWSVDEKTLFKIRRLLYHFWIATLD